MKGLRAEPPTARSHAVAVQRIRGTALGVALLPAAAAVLLFAAEATGSAGGGQELLRRVVTGFAVLVLAAAAGITALIVRARPAMTPTVTVEERSAPDLHALVRDLAERLDVPAPSAIALTPDCDSWLEDRTHPAQRTGGTRPGPSAEAPVLVIGSPFLWWMRVAELRALLAPVVAGTGPSAHPDIAAARRIVRALDAAVAVAERASPRRPALRFTGWLARLMLRACGPHAAEMERGVAAAAAHRAQEVDYSLRMAAQEQVGLAYAGWDRLLTRVALPAWRIGRWPSRLNAGVVSALTELSRRDRLAEGFAARLGERPACDLLDEPGAVDEAVSLLAARLFHGDPREGGTHEGANTGTGAGTHGGAGVGDGADADAGGPEWSPVGWQAYPEEVADRTWRAATARLFEALDATEQPEWAAPGGGRRQHGATLARIVERLAGGDAEVVAARVVAAVARADAAQRVAAPQEAALPAPEGGTPSAPGMPLRPPRSGRELMTEHVTAAVYCAAVDSAGAAPGLDWLDGPVLLIGGERVTDLARPVLGLVESGDPSALRARLSGLGIRPDKPIRLV